MDRKIVAERMSTKVDGLSYEDIMDYQGNIIIENNSFNTIFIEPGDFNKKFYYIEKGMVRAYYIVIDDNKNEIEKTIYIRKENEFFSDHYSILLDIPTKLHFECIENCIFYTFHFDQIQTYLGLNTNVMTFAFNYMMRILIECISRSEDFISLSPTQRYIKFVQDHSDVIDRISAKFIASMLGITPVSLSRIKRRIADKKK